MSICIDVGENGCEKFWFLFFRWQTPAERLTKPFNAFDEWCVRPIFFGKTLHNFTRTISTSWLQFGNRRSNWGYVPVFIYNQKKTQLLTYSLYHGHIRQRQNNLLAETYFGWFTGFGDQLTITTVKLLVHHFRSKFNQRNFFEPAIMAFGNKRTQFNNNLKN